MTRRSWTTVFIVDPGEWAAYLEEPDEVDVPDSPIVRAATPTVHGLPLRVVDELQEAEGAWGPAIALVDGEIVGIGPASH